MFAAVLDDLRAQVVGRADHRLGVVLGEKHISLCIHIYIYIHTHTCICKHILLIVMYTYNYTCISLSIYIERERCIYKHLVRRADHRLGVVLGIHAF